MQKFFITLLLLGLNVMAFAMPITGQVKLINQLDDPLTIHRAQHSEVIKHPEFDSGDNVSLPGHGGRMALLIETSTAELAQKHFSEVYVGAYDTLGHSAFFGIELLGDQALLLRGYIGHGIAFSWDHDSAPTLIFCSPAQYHVNQHC